MITGFEDVTRELSEEELGIVGLLVNGFKGHGYENPVKSKEVVEKMNGYLRANGYKIRLTGARLRKLCNHIRVNAIVPLIATSAGYYVSYDKGRVRMQINSLEQRARSIQSCAEGLKKFLEE